MNGSTKQIQVDSWEGDFNNNVLGTYALTAKLKEIVNIEVILNVIIVSDYITALTEQLNPIEIIVNQKLTSNVLPASIKVEYASGNSGMSEIIWDTNNQDTSKEGVIAITGTVNDYDSKVTLLIRIVPYKALYKFDFGINNDQVADGWTGITVNGKNETQTAASLGIQYSSEKGYGFDITDETIVNGRSEPFTYSNPIHPTPYMVYRDFALPAGLTFQVDVSNGKYIVELMSNSSYKSDIKGTIEETVNFSVANTASAYTIGSYEVEVKDGQLNIAFASDRVSRLGAIIIREEQSTKQDDPTTKGYTITYELDGGINHQDNPTEVDNNKNIKLKAPTKAGCLFQGWYTDKSFSSKITKISKKTNEDLIIYAKWEKIEVDKTTINALTSSSKQSMK
ncbi:hypothetical protein CG709_03995, partial [Lachnotalea glycerini]